MTHDDNIERVLERWFTEGPRHMPDRLFDGAFERIERLPRRRLADLPMRLSAMTRNARLAAAAALVVAVVGSGIALTSRMPGIGATATPASSAARSPIPTELQSVWVSVGSRGWLRIDSTTAAIPEFKADISSQASLLGPGVVEVRLENVPTGWDCRPDDVGTYAYVIDHATLSLRALTDACQARRAIFEGDWIHTDMGSLSPGKHQSGLFRPYNLVNDTVKVSYTVPAGWTDELESETQLRLSRVQGNVNVAEILVLADVSPYHQEGVGPLGPKGLAESCHETGADVIGTPAAVADWLASLPAFVVSKPTPVSIGGMEGIIVDLAMTPGWINTCSNNESEESVGVVYDTPGYTFAGPDPNPMLGLFGDERARYVLLDRGTGRSLVIAVKATDATWDATMAATMPIIESFEFSR